MKKLNTLMLAVIAILMIVGCKNKNNKQPDVANGLEIGVEADSTIYGICGEGTAMHTLQLITNQNDTLIFGVNLDAETNVLGGMFVGDRMAVIAGAVVDGDKTAKTVINLTSLLGKWTSIDRNFSIEEGGMVKSNVKAESNAWTAWKILNGQLLLNKDTFNITALGADSLYLENKEGIFVYHRQ